MPYRQRHYNYFQMIGYEIPTGTASKPGQEYNLSGYEKKGTDYLAVPDNLFDDARIRLKRLAGIVDVATRHIDKRQNVLKVLMAPEFYLRPQKGGPGRSYSREQMENITKALRKMFVHSDFIDWLFIPGTIVWNFVDPNTKSTVVFNQAIIIKGGQKEGPFTFIDKRHYSDSVDGIQQELWPEKNPRFKNLVDHPRIRLKAIQDIDNLRIGIEICRDHSLPFFALKKTLRYKIEREYNRRLLDLHLLTANSQQLTEFSVATYEGGYILREDGTSSPGRKPFSQIGLVTKQVLDDIDMVDRLYNHSDKSQKPKDMRDLLTRIPRRTRITPNNPFVNKLDWTWEISGDLKLKVPEQTDRNHPQRVVIFSPQRIKSDAPQNL